MVALEKRVLEAEVLPEEELRASNLHPRYVTPYMLSERIPRDKRAHVMAEVFEAMTAALFGGKCADLANVVSQDDDVSHPDVVDVRNNRDWESKAVHVHKHGVISHDQLGAYEDDQAKDLTKRIHYVFYRHGLKGIKTKYEKKGWRGTPDQLAYQLGQLTRYGIVLPLPVVKALHESSSRAKLVYRYPGSDEFDSATCINCATFTRLLRDPHEVLHGLDPEGKYTVQRVVTPRRFTFQGHPVKQFPVVRVYDRHYERYVHDLRAHAAPF